jgi:hypothetical protein
MQEEDSAAAEVKPEQAPLTCPNCGCDLPQFRRTAVLAAPLL